MRQKFNLNQTELDEAANKAVGLSAWLSQKTFALARKTPIPLASGDYRGCGDRDHRVFSPDGRRGPDGRLLGRCARLQDRLNAVLIYVRG